MAVNTSEKLIAGLKIEEDGSLNNKRMEVYALMVADGVENCTAWKTLGAKTNGGSGNYRRNVEKSRAFKERVKTLTDEKAELEAKGPLGRLMWMANQIWYRSSARDDSQGMQRAADLMLKVTDKMNPPAPPEGGKGTVGAPLGESPSSGPSDADRIRMRLMEKGRQAMEPETETVGEA